jgi:hypothetical protein
MMIGPKNIGPVTRLEAIKLLPIGEPNATLLSLADGSTSHVTNQAAMQMAATTIMGKANCLNDFLSSGDVFCLIELNSRP